MFRWMIGVLLLVGVFVVLRTVRIRHKLKWVLILLLGLFVYLTFMLSIAGENISLTSLAGVRRASGIYFSWLANAFDNLRTLTANAIKMDWNLNLDKVKPAFLK